MAGIAGEAVGGSEEEEEQDSEPVVEVGTGEGEVPDR